MKLKKIVATGLTMLFVLSSGTVFAYANTNIEENTPYSISDNELTQRSTTIFGENEKLYIEFSNSESAIEKIYDSQKEFINNISDYCNIEKLNCDNWEEFRTAFYKYVDEKGITDSSNEYKDLVYFFDIYENKDKNDEIVSFVKENNLKVVSPVSSFSKNNDAIDELCEMLPYTSDLVQSKNNDMLCNFNVYNNSDITPFVVINSFDTTKGIAYAEKHATNRNTPKYHSFSNGDCANFTSQILENGGVKQTVYDDASKGWWHKTSKVLGITKHTHSQAWSMADTFARYMGVSNKTKNHKTFAASLRAGDFITLDFKSDGDWDHMGFVTKRDSSVGSYGYIDYKVAQHTTDYNAWTSSNTNGWETNSGATYAIVRR